VIYVSLSANSISLAMLFCSGYISPEYAVDGLFSIKSDVFSFGVIVLEIVSGKKNRKFFHADHNHNLLGHVRTRKKSYYIAC
jgi:serine/threonine protein kinase